MRPLAGRAGAGAADGASRKRFLVPQAVASATCSAHCVGLPLLCRYQPLQVARGSLAAAVAGGYLFVFGGGKPNEQYNVVEW